MRFNSVNLCKISAFWPCCQPYLLKNGCLQCHIYLEILLQIQNYKFLVRLTESGSNYNLRSITKMAWSCKATPKKPTSKRMINLAMSDVFQALHINLYKQYVPIDTWQLQSIKLLQTSLGPGRVLKEHFDCYRLRSVSHHLVNCTLRSQRPTQ